MPCKCKTVVCLLYDSYISKKKLNVDMIFDSGFQSFLQSMGQYIVLLVVVHLDAHLCSMLEHVRGDSILDKLVSVVEILWCSCLP